LSGGANTDSLSCNFAAGDTITVNGTPITFVASGATGNQLNVTDSVQTLLTKIDSISGTKTPSTVSGGLISLNNDTGSSLSVKSSDPAAFAALGFTATATGAASGSAVSNKLAAPITGATLLNGAAATDSLSSNFVAGDTITVNGTPITFVAAGATGNQLNVTDSVQTLLSAVDAITGTGTPSTISGSGAISLHTNAGSSLAVSSSNPAALAALGFTATATAAVPPLRVSGSPLGAATSLTNGAANTIKWYTGNPGPLASARASSTARVDQSVTVEYGVQADESAIRTQLQNLAVFSAVTTSATNPNGAAQVTALSQRVAQNLTSQPGQQTIEDIQSDLATAQATMKDASARQTQAGATLQDLIDQAETVSPDQVASQVLALQNSLQASYQTTSMLSQLTLTKYLPVG
jgi:flagellar hook-associated protein 3 FlgL